MTPGWRREAVGSGTRDGTHRAAAFSWSWERVRPHLRACGVTRVAMLTGLDVIGLPVAAAYRPNSRSVAVHQGKGADDLAARVSAAMEAVETHHAECADLPLRFSEFAAMTRHGAALDPRTLPRRAADVDVDGRMLWCRGEDVADGSPVWVPHALVGIDLTVPSGPFQETTSGLASGNAMVEAVAHGLGELVERDAVALWQALQPAAREARAIDPASVTGAPAGLLARFDAAAIAVRMWDVSSDVDLPVFAALLAARDGGGVQPEMGFGCHADRGIALSRALTEAAQARLTVISGARDDLRGEGYDGDGLRDRHAAAADWFALPASRRFERAPDRAGETLREELDTMLRCLANVGLDRVVCVDLTDPAIGIPVVRVIVPGLEGPWTPPGGGYHPGARASRAIGSR